MRPSRNINVPKVTRRVTNRQRVLDFAAARGWDAIGEMEWQELRSELSGISEATLREAGVPIRAPWGGVAAHSMDELETSLRELSDVYDTRADLRRYCRDQVIAAKDRARWAAKSSKVEESKRRMKLEMVEWMLVWLGDPAMFPAWVQIRRQRMG
jgi:hypothetical protein